MMIIIHFSYHTLLIQVLIIFTGAEKLYIGSCYSLKFWIATSILQVDDVTMAIKGKIRLCRSLHQPCGSRLENYSIGTDMPMSPFWIHELGFEESHAGRLLKANKLPNNNNTSYRLRLRLYLPPAGRSTSLCRTTRRDLRLYNTSITGRAQGSDALSSSSICMALRRCRRWGAGTSQGGGRWISAWIKIGVGPPPPDPMGEAGAEEEPARTVKQKNGTQIKDIRIKAAAPGCWPLL